MEIDQKKPKLVFFQWKHDGLPTFLQLHMQLHVKCLSEFFEVALVNHDCDYQQICDQYQPDLTLFESGFRSKISRKLQIRNTSAYPQVPKLGLHNGDSWCDCRVGFISDMEHWGIENFFSICTTTAEHTPEIADKLYVWPNFIDPDICRDYQEPKQVPILFTGLMNSLYPWRQQIYNRINGNYPLHALAHAGYKKSAGVMTHGEQYARTINGSWFVPTCGTVAKEVVRKHFEIPGSKSCLLTEKAPSIEAAGFLDMENCVFADGENVLDKLEYLFKNTDELTRIINNGYELVQSGHTLKQRNQIFQWYTLNKNLKPGEIIVQSNPFQSLKTVPQSSGVKNTPIICNGLHLELLRCGDEYLWNGRYDQAEEQYLRCLDYINWMREPKLKLAICNLFRGDADAALRWVAEPINNNFKVYRAEDPDPVEWTYFVVSLLCKGKLEEAALRSRQFPLLSHPELQNIRWVISLLLGKDIKRYDDQHIQSKPRYTVHQVPKRSLEEWISFICVLLNACKQYEYVSILEKAFNGNEDASAEHTRRKRRITSRIKTQFIKLGIQSKEELSRAFKILYVQNPRRGLPPITQLEYFAQLSGSAKMGIVKRVFQSYAGRMSHLTRQLVPFQKK